MPKIIENLESEIITSASKLFLKQGFDHTNMRQIAENAGIAVGTLYRYYKNKEELYLKIMAENWQKTLDKLSVILEEEDDPEIAFQKMLEILIQVLQGHQSFSQLLREVAKMHIHYAPDSANGHFECTHEQLSLLFAEGLRRMLEDDISSEDEERLKKLGSFTFVMAVESCLIPSEDIPQQAAFITDIVSVYLRAKYPGRKFLLASERK